MYNIYIYDLIYIYIYNLIYVYIQCFIFLYNRIIIYCYMVNCHGISILVGGLEHVLFFHILGISYSQLTNSCFSQG